MADFRVAAVILVLSLAKHHFHMRVRQPSQNPDQDGPSTQIGTNNRLVKPDYWGGTYLDRG